MKKCSVVNKLEVVAGGRSDYQRLGRYHYRDNRLGVFAAIFALKPAGRYKHRLGCETAGVIVYTMPSCGLELRNQAIGACFDRLDKQSRLSLINRNIRCISRVIIDPRFRGLGQASRLVRETMGLMDAAIVEAVAVMGRVNRFFERAGMTSYSGPVAQRNVRLTEAFSMVAIEADQLLDAREINRRIDALDKPQRRFIQREIARFLQSYGKRRYSGAGIERTRFVLSKLTARPVYYVWRNENLELRI